jgi:hypothetical protein
VALPRARRLELWTDGASEARALESGISSRGCSDLAVLSDARTHSLPPPPQRLLALHCHGWQHHRPTTAPPWEQENWTLPLRRWPLPLHNVCPCVAGAPSTRSHSEGCTTDCKKGQGALAARRREKRQIVFYLSIQATTPRAERRRITIDKARRRLSPTHFGLIARSIFVPPCVATLPGTKTPRESSRSSRELGHGLLEGVDLESCVDKAVMLVSR